MKKNIQFITSVFLCMLTQTTLWAQINGPIKCDTLSVDTLPPKDILAIDPPEMLAKYEAWKKQSEKKENLNREANYDAKRDERMLSRTMQQDALSHIPIQVEINASKTVGNIPMQSAINPAGGMTYTIPIACIEGRNGHQPAISISYNSMGGNGVVGYGWSISGLSAIRRVHKNIYYNGNTSSMEMDKKDAFVLDGNHLLPISGSNSQFETEQGNIKIEKHISGNAVKYFIVKYPNGSIGTYGKQENENNHLSYPLRELTDRYGNTIKFDYEHLNAHDYIQRITYGKQNGQGADFGKIEFTYKNRPDITFGYEQGEKISENRLLENIISYNNNEVIHTYSFTYVTNKVSFLDQITADNLNPLKFHYGYNDPAPSLKKDTTNLLGIFEESVEIFVKKGKFDAGSDDDALMVYPNKPNAVYVKIPGGLFSHSQEYYKTMYGTETDLVIHQSLASPYSQPVKLKTGEGFMDLTSGDFDGTPGEEVVKINNTLHAGKDRVTFSVYKPNIYNGLGLLYTRDYDLNDELTHYNSISFWPKQYFTGDFNGNGKMEMLCVSINHPLESTDKKSKCTLIDLDKNTILYDAHKFEFDSSSDVIMPADFNGDGKTDICHVDATGIKIYTFKKQHSGYILELQTTYTDLKSYLFQDNRVLFGDINADGKMDIIVRPEATYTSYNQIYIPVSAPRVCRHCGKEYPIINFHTTECRSCHKKVDFVNYCIKCGKTLQDKGGGYKSCPDHRESAEVEIPEYHDNGNIWTIYYNKASKTDPFEKITKSFLTVNKNDTFIMQDVDQDGTTDIIRKSGSSVTTYFTRNGTLTSNYQEQLYAHLSSSKTKLITSSIAHQNHHNFLLAVHREKACKISITRSEARERLLTGSVSSTGIIQKNYYGRLNDGYIPGNNIHGRLYQEGYGATFPNINYIGPLWVVSKQEEYCKGALHKALSYNYYNAIVHRQGLGFRGYERTSTYNFLTGEYSQKTIDPIDFGKPIKEISTHTETIYQANVSIEANKKRRITIHGLTQKDNLKNTIVLRSFQYDNYGNILQERIHSGDGIGALTTQTYANITTSARYLIGQPLEKIVTRMRNGATWKDKEVITYHSNYLPATKTTYTGVNGDKKTGFVKWEYYPDGLLKSEKSAPYNVSELLGSTYEYDSQGRVTKVTDAMGLTTQYLEYNKFGKATKVKDFRAHTTVQNYDNWGQLTSVDHPDGVSESTTAAWGGQGLYTVTKTVTGKPTVVTHYDPLGREVRTANQRFDGAWQYADKQYDSRGRLEKTSLPFKGSSPTHWNTYTYDTYNRPTKLAEASGKSSTWSYNELSVTETKNGIATTKTTDASGALVKVEDPGGIIEYKLRPDGQPAKIIAPGGIETSFGYDAFGRQTSITDPSAGKQTFTENYTAAGMQTRTVKDARGKVVKSVYDKYGRITHVERPEFNTSYAYYPDAEGGQLKSENSTNGTSRNMAYDDWGRISFEEQHVDSRSFGKAYSYQDGSLLHKYVTANNGYAQPKMFTEEYIYGYGHLKEIKFNGQTSIWKLTEENALGQPTKATTGSLERTYGYTAYGMPTGRTAGNIQNFSYSFDPYKGNLLSRTDNTRNKTENFDYDHLNRLSKINGIKVGYAANGNITQMPGIGTMVYEDNLKPYQVTKLTLTGTTVPFREQHITYNSLQRPQNISEHDINAVFTYNASGERMKMDAPGADTRYYMDEYEIFNETQFIYLGGDAYSAPAVYVKTIMSPRWSLAYICRDYLGSITHIVKADGSLKQELSYSAWGRLRNPATQAEYAPGTEPALFLGRGYTGHEYLPWFGLINMNARLYDPTIGRFLSPDPYVQMPDFTQNFNRYSYCLNNPLVYVDENGEFIHLIIGAIVGGIVNWATHGFQFNAKGLGYFAVGAAVGTLSAAGGAWAATAFKAVGVAAGAGIGAVSGGVIGGGSNFLLNGGNNLIAGNNFLNNWKSSLISGAVNGAITGAIGGGFSGGKEALKQGKNVWWGNDVKYGRSQWSLFNTEKPFRTVDFDISNVGSKNLNDCVPTTFAEADDYFGGNTSYDQYKTATNYQENLGVSSTRGQYETLVSDNFNSSRFDGTALADPALAEQIQSRGHLVHSNMPHGGIRHADNLRSISYYHSGKVVMKFRIGSYRLSNVDNSWWFYLLRGVK